MNTAAKLSAYGVALAVLVTGAYGVGALAVGPRTAATAAGGRDDPHSAAVARQAAKPVGNPPGSRRATAATPSPTDPTLTPGQTETFAFRITGSDGAPVTAFDIEHDKRMP